jgi:acyl-CoA synthetase (AMP-forming)/AMP-acid ligase II
MLRDSPGHSVDETTLADLLQRVAKRAPATPALIFPDRQLSYSELTDHATRWARCLVGKGIKPGEHVGILMPNCLEYIELLLGISMIGAVCVPVNARYKAGELAYVIENADLNALITHDLASEYVDFASLLREAFPDLASSSVSALSLEKAPLLRFITTMGDSVPEGMISRSDFESAGETIHMADIEKLQSRVGLQDVAIMMYTSGTTANPKGCPLSHRALVRNGINMNRERYFLDNQDRFWAPLPMFHMASILPLVCCMDAGAALLSMNRFEPGKALAMMAQYNVTVAFPSFPTVTNDLISHADFGITDLGKLKRINNVAPVEMLRRFQAAFPQAIQTGAYGLTEASGVIAFNHPDEDLQTRLTTCGKPFAGIEVKIVDPKSMRELPTGEKGEILIRGYCLFEGYYKAPDKNAESFIDGWLHTGDLCSVDENCRISFHGRLKDMLKVGGENVAALEIESFLATHPAVNLAQVVGVPDDRLFEVAAAYVELHPNRSVTAEELIEFCTGKMASFKIPRHIRFVESWPMSATKVQKFRLQKMFESE